MHKHFLICLYLNITVCASLKSKDIICTGHLTPTGSLHSLFLTHHKWGLVDLRVSCLHLTTQVILNKMSVIYMMGDFLQSSYYLVP